MQEERGTFPFKWLVGVIGCVGLLVVLVASIAWSRGWGSYLRLMSQGTGCQATVIRLDRQRCVAEYAFSVAGRSYSGRERTCDVELGQLVEVTYLIADPSSSCLGRPGDRLLGDLVALLFGRLSFPELS
jgi:hypothetical protein